MSVAKPVGWDLANQCETIVAQQKKNTHTNKHSVFKKRSETESSQSTEHLSQMVASDYCFKKTSLRIQNFT